MTTCKVNTSNWRWLPFYAGVFVLVVCKTMAPVTAAATFPGSLQAAAIRGRIDWRGPSGPYPAAGIAVTVAPQGFDGDRSRTSLVYTGPDGMYYFTVAPGNYVLRVWVNSNQSKAFIIGARPGQNDIAPIQIP